jgi:hypothetical protein
MIRKSGNRFPAFAKPLRRAKEGPKRSCANEKASQERGTRAAHGYVALAFAFWSQMSPICRVQTTRLRWFFVVVFPE